MGCVLGSPETPQPFPDAATSLQMGLYEIGYADTAVTKLPEPHVRAGL